MKDFNDFLIIGGDLRFVYAAARLARAGYSCSLFGFDALHDDVRGELKAAGVSCLKRIDGHKSANVVLPLPMSRNCDYITAPYHSGRIAISAVISVCAENATVYCGKACPELQLLCDKAALTLVDYFEREELTVVNAAIAAFIISPLKTPSQQGSTNPLFMRVYSPFPTTSLYHKGARIARFFGGVERKFLWQLKAKQAPKIFFSWACFFLNFAI